ncbi:hypothetical protein ACKRZS_001560 [Fusarium odoratissimum]|uniref:Uncharacterized protein n=2 Tax=Fusarium oxysporum species complex TaxID=171631 RepID=X0JGJ6_FUSO5|nr:uncharacterized protein FOIG_11960 [Fusarium odoratissimum NRRL 54006]EXL95445.1 hypothetical protein FOIG_11960 [Fusarium odoratissimum NRRL 54006]TXC06117.1 hypothetical protein FocTR4_00010611 [Fusarium oxysporum f. sp. cubense]
MPSSITRRTGALFFLYPDDEGSYQQRCCGDEGAVKGSKARARTLDSASSGTTLTPRAGLDAYGYPTVWNREGSSQARGPRRGRGEDFPGSPRDLLGSSSLGIKARVFAPGTANLGLPLSRSTNQQVDTLLSAWSKYDKSPREDAIQVLDQAWPFGDDDQVQTGHRNKNHLVSIATIFQTSADQNSILVQ